MPRFVGKRSHGLWLDIVALVILAVIVFVVLEVAGAINVFGVSPGPVLV